MAPGSGHASHSASVIGRPRGTAPSMTEPPPGASPQLTRIPLRCVRVLLGGSGTEPKGDALYRGIRTFSPPGHTSGLTKFEFQAEPRGKPVPPADTPRADRHDPAGQYASTF